MGKIDPLVSVVLPTYNRERLIGKSIQSVLGQTYENFELIVVDDASSDGTVAVVEGFDDDRIRLIEHETNKGAPAARNTGISESTGDFVAFQDSDDEWVPYKLEKQVGWFRHLPESVGVVYTGMWRIIDGRVKYLPYPSIHPKDGDIRPSIVKQNFISTPVAMVRRECFDEVGDFDEEILTLNDWELWLRIAEEFEFALIDEPLVISRMGMDSISTNQQTLVETRRLIVDKHHKKFDTSALANHLFFIGHGSMKVGDQHQGRAYLKRAIKTDVQPLYILAFLLSLGGARLYRRAYHWYKQFSGAVLRTRL